MTRPSDSAHWWLPPRLLFPAAMAGAVGAIVIFVSSHEEAVSVGAVFSLAHEMWFKSLGGSARFAAACAIHARAIGVAVGILGAAVVAGRGPLAWLGCRGGLFAIALGLGAFAALLLGLAVLGLLAPGPILAAGVLAACVGWAAAPQRSRLAGTTWWPAWILAVLGAMLLTDLMACLGPEWFLDGRMYHLGLPERFLLTHKFPVMAGHMLTFLPLNTEMLYSAAMAFGGEEAAKVLNLAFGILLLGAVAGLARELAGPGAGPYAGALAALALCAFPLTMVENEISFSDNLRATWETLALLAAVRGINAGGRGRDRWLGGAAACAGLAMGSKYLAVIRGGLLTGAILLLSWFGRPAARRRRGARFVLAATVAVAPWLARNWLAGRDPVYPFGFRLFASLGYSAGELAAWMGDNRHYGVAAQTIGRWLTLPVRVALEPVPGEFGTFTTGPLAIAFGALLLARRRWGRGAGLVAGVAAVEALVWSRTSELIRYLLPALAAFAAATGWLLATLHRDRPRWGRLFVAVLALWAGCTLVLRVHHRYNLEDLYGSGGFLFGKFTAADAAEGRGFGRALAALPPGPVLLVGEDQVLGAGRRWEGCTVYNRMTVHRWAQESRDAGRFAVKVRQSGARAVILNGPGFEAWQRRGPAFTLSARELAVVNPWWRSLRKSSVSGPRTYYTVPSRIRIQ